MISSPRAIGSETPSIATAPRASPQAGDKPAGEEPDGHGRENPQRQEPVEGGELGDDAGLAGVVRGQGLSAHASITGRASRPAGTAAGESSAEPGTRTAETVARSSGRTR